jgi:hypothetical protein
MYIHPELGWRLAQAKTEEARSWTHRAPAPRAASLDTRTQAVTVGRRRKRRPAPSRAGGRSRFGV